MTRKRLKRGLIQVYTGNGKGKTTAALGLALRAMGHELSVYIIQFLKGDKSAGELKVARKLFPKLIIRPMGRKVFVDPKRPAEVDRNLAKRALDLAKEVVAEGRYDIVVLDEVNVAIHLGLIPLEAILALMHSKPPHVEMILTGRYAKPEILEKADLTTEMKAIRHYYDKGISARKGIEI